MGQGLLNIEDLRSRSDTPHSVALFWTSDQPDAETSPDNSLETDIYDPAGFEPTVPVRERPQAHALDRASTAISGINP